MCVGRSLLRRVFALLAALAVAAGAPLRAHAVPTPAEGAPVLVIVLPGAEFARVEAVRAAIPASRTPVLIGASERVLLAQGLELLVDRSFEDAPPAEVIVVVPGEPPSGVDAFLRARRGAARAILFLEDSPLIARVKADGSRGAAILVGATGSIPALLGMDRAVPPSVAPGSSSQAATPVTLSPTATPTSSKAGATFDRYFSSGAASRATRTPTPTPRK